jgi:hypothetical protein
MLTRFRSHLMIATALALSSTAAHAFCGFYVGKADASLFNDASQVVLVRDGDRTVVTMSNDYKGELTDFALVVPVPSVISKDQIHIGDRKYIERLDAYSAPRLVEYHDPDPCELREEHMASFNALRAFPRSVAGGVLGERADALGVTVEASYAIGEYDILILSAKESAGLETWLRESGYRIPAKASAALAPYIRQDMKFFVAKVNLKNQKAGGFSYLRPIQIAYESPKFMLPIRLGMANARGPQDLVVYALTRKGRVESTNYRTAKMPSGMDVPVFVKREFPSFYKAAFDQAHQKENGRALLTEYVWNMAWCDPCAAAPLTTDELRQLGVFWLDEGVGDRSPLAPGARAVPSPQPVTLTRLHVRYDDEHFPEDLMFQETGDQENFQARYVLRHAFEGSSTCPEANQYRASLAPRHQTEARTLAELTGWALSTIQRKMGSEATVELPWYKRIWR